jgi:hypothetical protein
MTPVRSLEKLCVQRQAHVDDSARSVHVGNAHEATDLRPCGRADSGLHFDSGGAKTARMNKSYLLVCICPLVVACTTAPNGESAPDGEVSSLDAGPAAENDAGWEFDGGSLDASADSDAKPAPSCPTVEPQLRTACQGKLRCRYGDDPDPACRYNVSCKKDEWALTNNIDGCGWIQCPTAKPSSTDRCTDSPATSGGCWWADGTYCACGYGKNWKCYAPGLATGCPKTPPNSGSACTSQGLKCSYCGLYENTCTSGVWLDVNGGRSCPAPN